MDKYEYLLNKLNYYEYCLKESYEKSLNNSLQESTRKRADTEHLLYGDFVHSIRSIIRAVSDCQIDTKYNEKSGEWELVKNE